MNRGGRKFVGRSFWNVWLNSELTHPAVNSQNSFPDAQQLRRAHHDGYSIEGTSLLRENLSFSLWCYISMNHQVFALVGNSEKPQTDACMRARPQEESSVSATLSELDDWAQLTLFPDRAQRWLLVPGCTSLDEQHAKNLLFRGMCQCQGPDALSQTFHQQWHLLFSQAGPATSQVWGSFPAQTLLSAVTSTPKSLLRITDCCPSSSLHGFSCSVHLPPVSRSVI